MGSALCNDLGPYLPPVPAHGWMRAINLRVAHYFAPVRSLCGRWENEAAGTREADTGAPKCAVCARTVARRVGGRGLAAEFGLRDVELGE
jgi:hypothetical protein